MLVTEVAASEKRIKMSLSDKKVLIVEDNELNMKLFHDLLEAHGIQTVETREGTNVLELARTHRPDLILMDIQLPEVSGLDVTKWLKNDQELRHIPVIAVTAFAMKGDEQKIREGGCEDYISKPISVVRFLEMIDSYLNKIPPQNVKISHAE
jgi:two-component system cell cycle response regulator DivK